MRGSSLATRLFLSATAWVVVILVITGGIEAGVNGAWSGLLPQILKNSGYDESYIGWTGFY